MTSCLISLIFAMLVLESISLSHTDRDFNIMRTYDFISFLGNTNNLLYHELSPNPLTGFPSKTKKVVSFSNPWFLN